MLSRIKENETEPLAQLKDLVAGLALLRVARVQLPLMSYPISEIRRFRRYVGLRSLQGAMRLFWMAGAICACPFQSRSFSTKQTYKVLDASSKSRPHKSARSQLRTSIPFLDHLKQCRDPDEFLTIFHDYYDLGYKHDYPSYASLIYKLARARKFEDIEVVLDFLKTHDIKCGESLFAGLIRHYGKANLIDKAVEVFREIGRSFNCVRPKMGFKLNSVSFNIMIKMWLEKGDWEKARKIFDEMLEREVEPTVVTYNSQIGFLCKRGDVDEAKRFLEDMRSKGKPGNAVTYALLMEGLCASGNLKEAKKMMFDMEYQGCKVQLVNYGVLMTDLARRGLIDEAKGAVSEAYKVLVDMQVKGCKPNAATYRMVVDCFCKVEDFVGGLNVLNAMLNSGHFPRTETFCSLFIGLGRSAKIDDACFILEEMKKRKISLDSDSWEILLRETCIDDKFVTRSGKITVGYDEHFILKKIKRKISWDLDCHRLFFLPVDVFLAGNRNVVGDGGGVVGRALDKFARALIEEQMGDLYKELNSKEAKRQNAVLLLLASIVRCNSQLAWELAKVFDFKLTGFPKLAELSLRRKKFVDRRRRVTPQGKHL
ncbi:Pentatricopeptide repeat-containing protein, mitochondrial [Sesamum angolense]|uniref:Pentatricopeptide repeat-containing protein, mitochondrial n=1 Tax=Sesamum angolense TaxID=2727404 RepID=A0AAE1T9B5_9LAMI|nr:Pentatricopeptide repeat-containing protein, mitochondrial [Sesamum angolense]